MLLHGKCASDNYFLKDFFQVYCFYFEGSDEEGSDSNDEAEDVLLEGEEAKEKKPVVLIEQEDPDEKGGKKKKKSRKRAQNNCKNCKEKGHLKKECPQLSEERRKELQDLYTMKVERKGHGTGRKKNKNKKGATEGSNSGGEEETPSAKANSESCENSSSAGKYVRLQQPGKENEPAGGTPKKIDHQKTDRNVHSQKGDKNKRGKKEKKPKMDITGQEVQDDEGLFQVLYDCFCFTHKNLRRSVTVGQNAICRILTDTGKTLWVFLLFAGLPCS